jgi:hypothetical protein
MSWRDIRREKEASTREERGSR